LPKYFETVSCPFLFIKNIVAFLPINFFLFNKSQGNIFKIPFGNLIVINSFEFSDFSVIFFLFDLFYIFLGLFAK